MLILRNEKLEVELILNPSFERDTKIVLLKKESDSINSASNSDSGSSNIGKDHRLH